MSFGWKGAGNNGHIINAERLSDGTLRLYDPQEGKIISNNKDYLKQIKLKYGIDVLKVDDLDFNIDIIDEILKKS